MEKNVIDQKISVLQQRDIDDHSMKLLLIAQFHVRAGLFTNAENLINIVEKRMGYK